MRKNKPIGPARIARATFGAIDALIILAAIGIGMGVYWIDQEVLESWLGLPDSVFPGLGHGRPFLDTQSNTIAASLTRWRLALVHFLDRFLPFVTLGAAAATFRHRGSYSRRSLRHIGTLTTAVTAIFAGISLANEYVLRKFPALLGGYSHNPLDTVWWFLGEETSLGVVALWCILAIGRRWRPAPDWTDRLGRGVGAAWVLRAVLGVLLKYAFFLS